MSEEIPNDPAEELRILHLMHRRLSVDYERAISDYKNISAACDNYKARLKAISDNHGDLHTELVDLLDCLHAPEYAIGQPQFIRLVEHAVGYDSIREHRRSTR